MKVTAAYSCIITLTWWAFSSAPVFAQGQQGSGSPYSAFGFGDLQGATQVVQATAGGAGIAIADPYGVSLANPASYAGLAHTAFETGLVVRNTRSETNALTSNGRNSRLLGLTIGVPFGRGRWGMALGLSPTTAVNYQLDEQVAVEGGAARFEYTGSGGLNRAFIGFGHVIWQRSDSTTKGGKLSAGANIDYLFGTMTSARKAYYPANAGYYNTSASSSLVVRSPSASFGLQYADDLIGLERAKARMAARKERLQAKDRREEMDWLNAGRDPKERRAVQLPKGTGEALRFRIGVAAELPATLAARHTVLVNNFVIGSTGVEFPRDTAVSIEGARGQLELPFGIGFGFTVYNRRWSVTAEHKRRDWSRTVVDVEGYPQRNELTAGSSYALGASFRPAGDEAGNLITGTIYRAGLRYADDYVTIKGTALTQIGMSFGISLPVGSRSRSRLNLGTELGQRGTTNDGLLLERYANVYIGITITPELNEPWFKKRRID
ncbi:MAG: hypothetical protein IPM46_01815 [Flavobacteriales bacterium]|nr:hypothetical protein [Flavobacteriales bacterium]